jgi:3-hydroxybutyrate dehydrogenase
MDYGLSGRVVVVTGAAGGIGTTLVREYGAQGARVALLDRERTRLVQVAESLPGESLVVEAELTDDASVAAAVVQLSDRWANIDILVNNAGVEYATPLRDGASNFMDKWDDLLRNNVGSMVRLTRALLPHMRPGGSIINQSSVWGKKGVPEFSAYVASKHAIIGVTRSLAWELASSGIRVNAVCPGWIQTEAAVRSLHSMAESSARTPDEVLKEILAGQVMSKFLQPADLAGAFLFLASDGARAINGQTIVVSHGEVMN